MNVGTRKLVTWLDTRTGSAALRNLINHKSVPVHRFSALYLLGGITLFLLGVQLTTGLLLMFYYQPSSQLAFESIQLIMGEVSYGWLVRALHSWSAHLMIFFTFVHLCSVFFMKAYRKPRELTWVTGCLLLFLLLGFGFSGSLLPWNKLSYFATRVGAGMAGSLPVIGDWVQRVMLGGDRLTGATLGRFYALHVFVLPLLTMGLIGVHLQLVQHHGMSTPTRVDSSTRSQRAMKFFPHFLLRDLLSWLVVLSCLLALATFFPPELGEKANPLEPAYANIRPEWYFVFMFQSLKLMPPGEILGLELELIPFLVINLGALVLLLVPFIDRGIQESPRFTAAGIAILVYMVAMTAWGYRSLGPVYIAAATCVGLLLLMALMSPREPS